MLPTTATARHLDPLPEGTHKLAAKPGEGLPHMTRARHLVNPKGHRACKAPKPGDGLVATHNGRRTEYLVNPK